MPDRHVDVLIDLFLKPTGRPGHQHLGLRVEDQDGRGISIQDLAYPVEQLGEQVVEPEARQRRVRQGAEPLPPLLGVLRRVHG